MDDLGNDLLANVLEGYNMCLFAYGQTGSGKTYSVVGPAKPQEQRGLLPRIMEGLFAEIERRGTGGSSFTCSATYMEIYNERIRDLLKPSCGPCIELKVRESRHVGVYVQGLTDVPIRTLGDVHQTLDAGLRAKAVAATDMNDVSSRSHCIFTVELVQSSGGVASSQLCSKINLVDLAGSER